jgi:hypothetical protein
VDFLHQFCRLVVSKEDKARPGPRSGRRFARREGLRRYFPRRRHSVGPGNKMRWI